MYTVSELERDIRALGISGGDSVFRYSSYKSLGDLTGGSAIFLSQTESASELRLEKTRRLPSFPHLTKNSFSRLIYRKGAEITRRYPFYFVDSPMDPHSVK